MTRWLGTSLAAFYLAQWAVIGEAFLTSSSGGASVLVISFVCLVATAWSYRKVGHGAPRGSSRQRVPSCCLRGRAGSSWVDVQNRCCQGQRERDGRCSVHRQAVRVSRPGIVSSRRRNVFTFASRGVSSAPSSWVQRIRLCARMAVSSQAVLALNTPEGQWFNPVACRRTCHCGSRHGGLLPRAMLYGATTGEPSSHQTASRGTAGRPSPASGHQRAAAQRRSPGLRRQVVVPCSAGPKRRMVKAWTALR
jgi:hypothetical protein